MENSNSKLTYSKFIEEIEADNVSSVEIDSDGETAYVTLKSEKSPKQVNIPSLDGFMTYAEDYIKVGAFTLESKTE